MKSINKILILLISVVLLFSCEEDKPIKGGIKFEKLSLDEAFKKADGNHKILFVDAYATWCGPCKKLAKTTFVDKSVEKLFNSNFVNLKIDVDLPENKLFVEKYEINSIPTMLFFDSKGNVIKRLEGFYDEEELLNEIKQFVQ